MSGGWFDDELTASRPYADAAAATLVIVIFWLPPTLSAGDWSRTAAGCVLAAVTGWAMLVRRRRPGLATVAAGFATLAGASLGVTQDPMLATAWCLYPFSVTRAARTRVFLLVLVGLLTGLAVVTGIPDGDTLGRQVIVALVALSVAWLLGTAVGRQITATREAERARVQLEIARDVHDAVGHALGVIAAEAGVTRALPDAGEQELRETLAAIESHAREALEDVQGVVRTLRAEPDRLSALIETTRAAGVTVDARIDVPPTVEAPVRGVLYRIVQEALHNVVRHAPGARCSVDVRADGDALVVCVRDHGARTEVPGGPVSGSGVGLRGMVERARSVGGGVGWSEHPDGGFAVEARLPHRVRA